MLTPLARALLALALLSAPAAGSLPAETLRVVSWGGSYVRSQILGFIRPFEAATGVEVEILEYTGGLDEIRSQVRSLNVKWDVVDFELFDAIQACREGLILPIGHAALPPAPDGTPAAEDFIQGSLIECGVGNVVFSTVVAYDRLRFENPPSRLEDFFDTRTYPGPRGLRRSPQGNLEWALLSDGVPREDIYKILDTDEGLDRAFRILDSIKPFIVWWEAGEEAVRLLEEGEVTMSSAYNGRVYAAAQRGATLDILWDGQVWFIDVWGVVKGSKREALAREFVRFATSTESLARQAAHIPYGPARKSSLEKVPPEIRPNLPTAEKNFRNALESNAQWWAENRERLNRRFERWLRRPVMVPERLTR